MLRKITLFFLISFVLTSIWFGPNKLIAHAEEGIPFYNLQRTFQIYSSTWQEVDLGSAVPLVIPRLTFYGFTKVLDSLSIPSIQIQQLIFFSLIFIPLISVPALANNLFPNSSRNTGLYAALFYLFNLFVLTQVWHRFIYSLFFLWSYLPLFLYLWLKWLESRKIKYLLFFGVSSIVFSDIYVLLSPIIALWIPAGVLWPRHRRIVPAIVAVVVWLLTSIWWLYPIVNSKDNQFKKLINSDQNLISLIDVSKYYPSSDIILLKQKHYFSPQTIWFNFFANPYVNYLNWIFPISLLIGLISIIKSKSGRLIIVWLVISWIFVNGANSQLGTQFYEWLFRTFPFTMVLRNPYEKLGVMFLLPYSLVAAMGLSKIPFRILRTIIVFVVCFILLRPMWTGQVFSGYQVEVPASYEQANSYLNTQSNLRLLQLPFLQGAGTTYSWGYSGEEPSNFLFDRPSLSGTYFSPTDPYLFLYKRLRLPKVYRLFQLFAIDTIVLHKDTLPGPAYQEDYAGSRELLKNIENISLAKEFADLDIYQLNSNLPVDWGYLSNRTFSVSSLDDGFDLVTSNDLFKLHNDTFVISSESLKLFGKDIPNYTVAKLSPVRYVYRIKEAVSPYTLVLSQSFNLSWTATIDKKEIKNHFEINGYANGWLIDQKGDYVVDIMFKTWPWE